MGFIKPHQQRWGDGRGSPIADQIADPNGKRAGPSAIAGIAIKIAGIEIQIAEIEIKIAGIAIKSRSNQTDIAQISRSCDEPAASFVG
ncbi:MAG: hypothetical protein EA001_06545 [Oscillatoriales cyanobacterium]|nr:MAG: hypothetical protein EA001_06545 [Oscillatoriales cyanobacterium]